MKRWVILIFSVLLFLLKANAQNEYVNWYFGNHIGLNFCNGLHVSEVSQFTYDEVASATISDKNTGQMLFHTDGETVWNNQLQIMQNGSGLKGNNESSGAVIVPQPGNDSIYYIFTTGENDTPPDSLEYDIVNMNKNSELGAVISKNNFLHYSCEQLTAVYNKTGNFYWILCLDSDNFLEYQLGVSGLNVVPVLYPTNVEFMIWDDYCSGVLKSSPNAKMLACSYQGFNGVISLYNFDNISGDISYISQLQVEASPYDTWGLSFSPNNSKLYVVTYDTFSKIYQYDVTSGNPISINNSQIKLYSYNYASNGHIFASMQLGPDRKLYIEREETDSLTVIDAPDSAGLACDFRFNAIALDGVTGFGLSDNIDNLYEWAQPPTLSVTANSQGCNGMSSFNITASKNYNDFEVSYGDGTDTILDSLQFSASHFYNTSGNYIITIRGLLGCVYDSVSAAISIVEPCVQQLIIPTLIYGNGSQTKWTIINLPQGSNSVVLYDELGRVIYNSLNYPNDFDMRSLPSAMYFYRLTLESGQVYVGKIVVVR